MLGPVTSSGLTRSTLGLYASLLRYPFSANVTHMSAVEIIHQIRQLPDGEVEKVKRFVRENLEPGQLSAAELGALTRQMVEATDPAEADRIERVIIRGFYGDAGPET